MLLALHFYAEKGETGVKTPNIGGPQPILPLRTLRAYAYYFPTPILNQRLPL
jgi:hypothetical protein